MATAPQYANEQVSIFIGDQADRLFGRDFKSQVPHLGVVIDDGDHTTQQQLNVADFTPGEEFKTKAQPFQTMIHAIHLYPYMAVILPLAMVPNGNPSTTRNRQTYLARFKTKP